MDDTTSLAVGRRKSAVARVWLRPGKGSLEVNGRPVEEYFPIARHRNELVKPLVVTGAEGSYAVTVRVRGGGITGQAEAIRLGLARALVESDPDRRSVLRANGLLTRDARAVERKKPGRPGARKRFQFSKR